MAYALNATDPTPRGAPYITVDEYLQSSAGLDVSNLVKGDREASLAELARRIGRAGAWLENVTNQPLVAFLDTETTRRWPTRDGLIVLHPRYTPVRYVTAISVGAGPSLLAAVTDLSSVWAEDDRVEFPVSGLSGAWPALNLTGARSSGQMYVSYSYVPGWANTTLSGAATAGATSLTVASPHGIVPGLTFTLYDGIRTEDVTVAAGHTTGSTTVSLAAGLTYDHAAGVGASALPEDVKEYAITLTSALIRNRGAEALVMSSMTSTGVKVDRAKAPASGSVRKDVADALAGLGSYRRVR